MKPIERVSIIVPMLNEVHRVDQLVRDLSAQDFSGEMEVFVADGGSTDGSVQLLIESANQNGIAITVLENPDRTVPMALNRCIEQATGDLVVRLDCRSRYPSDYVRQCVLVAEETGGWNVGGLLLPEGETRVERAAACAMASPFGGISWWREAGSSRVAEVDTVYCGAFRRNVFSEVGVFDPEMAGAHDEELNVRIRQAGGKVVLSPAIRAYYRPASSYRNLFRRYADYGFHKPRVMRKYRRVISGRSLVPPAFVASLALLLPLAVRFESARKLMTAELTLYGAGALGFAAASVRSRRERLRLIPAVAAVFPAFHLGYGFGFLRGLLRLLVSQGPR